ncbi:hypothetical protein [Trujillonella endophytica]|uniref:hypothetical protein n=1 Tax=Trujillonella endophytica TaxID=673521 RepID=UPI001113B647|nr:hypothetical protein [Trujillella endophytica]
MTEEYRRTYRSGLSRFDEKRDPVDHQIDLVLPAEFGPVHAVQVTRVDRGLSRPQFLPSPLTYKTALCGAAVKVELPMEFDPGDDDSCPRCVGPALRNERTPRRHQDEPRAEPVDDALLELSERIAADDAPSTNAQR